LEPLSEEKLKVQLTRKLFCQSVQSIKGAKALQNELKALALYSSV
jgi:hypothetical protein